MYATLSNLVNATIHLRTRRVEKANDVAAIHAAGARVVRLGPLFDAFLVSSPDGPDVTL